jgi:hypothetical protein
MKTAANKKRHGAGKKSRTAGLTLLVFRSLKEAWGDSLRKRIMIVFLALVFAWFGIMYGVAQWYIRDQASRPLRYGVTFIAPYAQHLGVDPKETLHEIIYDLGIRQLRLVSYWNIHEANRGQYDFEDLDWQFAMAEQSGSKVSLAIGLRQPRWPECHMPTWAEQMPMNEWAEEVKKYMAVVIDRYQHNPALESYQLENEFFMEVFGICPDHSRGRLVDEYHFVKSLTGDKPIIISRSNNWIGMPLNEPLPDEVAISVYKRVWDSTITKRYFEYPLPAWFYASLGGLGKILTGRDLIIHELQAEAWLPEGYQMNNVEHIEEQNKSINAERLRDRIEYGRATGLREIYLWGVEWWYWRKVVVNDLSLWEVGREEIAKAMQQN